jgi:uracil phosphoribosyltransferase
MDRLLLLAAIVTDGRPRRRPAGSAVAVAEQALKAVGPHPTGPARRDPLTERSRLGEIPEELRAAPQPLARSLRVAHAFEPAQKTGCLGVTTASPPVADDPLERGWQTAAMRHLVVDHPLVAHKLTALRDRNTDSPTFRRLTDELVSLLGYEATRTMPLVEVALTTPVAETTGRRLRGPAPLVVPVLRSGLGMLDGMLRMLPGAEVGFLGMVRDETTLHATTYATRLPADLDDRRVIVLDPMLATGGTLSAAVRLLLDRGAADVTAICLIAAPEGVGRMQADFPGSEVTLVTAGLDERLNDVGYIVPGLGDAGDRLYGEVSD